MRNCFNVCNRFDVINQVEKIDKGKASSETKPTPKDFATGQGLKGILKKEGYNSFRKQSNEVQESSSGQTNSKDVTLQAKSSKRYDNIEKKKQKSKVHFKKEGDESENELIISEIEDTRSAKEIMEIYINDLEVSLEDLQRNYQDLGKKQITLMIGEGENKAKYRFTQKDIASLQKSSKKIIKKCKKEFSQKNFKNIKKQVRKVAEHLEKLRKLNAKRDN